MCVSEGRGGKGGEWEGGREEEKLRETWREIEGEGRLNKLHTIEHQPQTSNSINCFMFVAVN